LGTKKFLLPPRRLNEPCAWTQGTEGDSKMEIKTTSFIFWVGEFHIMSFSWVGELHITTMVTETCWSA
jgi:hypothetical protein